MICIRVKKSNIFIYILQSLIWETINMLVCYERFCSDTDSVAKYIIWLYRIICCANMFGCFRALGTSLCRALRPSGGDFLNIGFFPFAHIFLLLGHLHFFLPITVLTIFQEMWKMVTYPLHLLLWKEWLLTTTSKTASKLYSAFYQCFWNFQIFSEILFSICH